MNAPRTLKKKCSARAKKKQNKNNAVHMWIPKLKKTNILDAKFYLKKNAYDVRTKMFLKKNAVHMRIT